MKIMIAACKSKIMESKLIHKNHVIMPNVDYEHPFIETTMTICSDLFESLNSMNEFPGLTSKKCYMVNCLSIFFNKELYTKECLDVNHCLDNIRNKTSTCKDILRNRSFEDMKSQLFQDSRQNMKNYFERVSLEWDKNNLLVKQTIIEEPLRLTNNYNSEEFKKKSDTICVADKKMHMEDKRDILSIVQDYNLDEEEKSVPKMLISCPNAEFNVSVNHYCQSILDAKKKESDTQNKINKLLEFKKFNKYMKSLSIEEKRYLFDKFQQLSLSEFMKELNRVICLVKPLNGDIIHIPGQKKVSLTEEQVNLLGDIIITELKINDCPSEIADVFKNTWKKLFFMSFSGFEKNPVREDVFGLYYDVILMTCIKLTRHYAPIIDKMKERLSETYYDTFTKNLIEVRYLIYMIQLSVPEKEKSDFLSFHLSILVSKFVYEHFNKKLSFDTNIFTEDIDKLFADFNITIEESCSIILKRYDYEKMLDKIEKPCDA